MIGPEDLFSSPSSDEKMETGTESYRSAQLTPNSVLSSDYEDRDQPSENSNDDSVLRLQNPNNQDNPVLRLSEPTENKIINKRLVNITMNDSLISKMENLQLSVSQDSDGIVRPANLGISPPKFNSMLTSTINHPLMGLGSPDSVENYPDVVPKKGIKKYDEEPKDLSLSSIEDDRNTNSDFYGPQRNSSKNNLYFSENFSTAENQSSLPDNCSTPPDITRFKTDDKDAKWRLKPLQDIQSSKFYNSTPVVQATDLFADSGKVTPPYIKGESRLKDKAERNGLKFNAAAAVEIHPHQELYHTGVAEWCESPSHLRLMPNFELPIEMSSDVGLQNGIDSPDVQSSTAEDKSSYCAMLDPRTGNVTLHHTSANTSTGLRRRILLPEEDDGDSMGSVSDSSLHSEEEPPGQGAASTKNDLDSDGEDDEKRASVSSGSSSSPIPEYSAAEEFHEERAWLKVPLTNGGHATCDMKVISPFKRVLSHGGYGSSGVAVIVFSACYLPDNARSDYRYVMDNLFLYVIWTLERLVTDEYILVYLHGSARSRRLPGFRWLRECYKLVDRRLRKCLKQLFLVHPTLWLKSLVLLCKPFVSSKFMRKLIYVNNLKELQQRVPVEPNAIPDLVKEYDSQLR